MRLWARTTSDYSKAFTRIRDAVAAPPVESAVLDGEAIVMRPGNTTKSRALCRTREAVFASAGRPLSRPETIDASS